ncbi:uncharacterized protein LOC117574410 [Drosophila albomicans]|uniref:Uncharacterized protein LOC117574410 n=1 Tax=Drosophila albomicans TaxID=7291 RepID=A0A6P8XME9_DROAB|nr:uncharacterized protein LOC117574410 [Drosophila albomicans]
MSDSRRGSKDSAPNSPKPAQSPKQDETFPKSPIRSEPQSIRPSISLDEKPQEEINPIQRNSIPKSNNESAAVSGSTSPKAEVQSSSKSPTPNKTPTAPTSKRTSVERVSTRQRRLEYFRSGIDADCEVHVPQNADLQQGGNVCYKKFPCHRIFLATASEKLEQDILKNKQWNGVLQINGVSPESVEIFLEYIYTFEISSSQADLRIIGDIYILSTAYDMPELLITFSKQLKNVDWPLDDIIPAFNLAFQHNMLDLESACLAKILEQTAQLKGHQSIMKLQIYAFNYLVQHWKVTETLATGELIQLLQKYQRENDLNFKNTKQFPHFSKICQYFPDVLLDADGIIHIK